MKYSIYVSSSANSSKNVISVTECENDGTNDRRHSLTEYHEPMIQYQAGATAADDRFFIRGSNGSRSVALSYTNVVLYKGSAHGKTSTYALANQIKTDKEGL